MAPKIKSRASHSLPKKRTPAPLTVERLVPLFEDMKDMMRSTARATETALREEFRQELRGEIGSLRSELKSEIQSLRIELKKEIRALSDKMDITQYAVTEHTKHIVNLQARAVDHETRIAHLE